MTAPQQLDAVLTDRDQVCGRQPATITDDFMRGRIAQVRSYTVVLLLRTASYDPCKHAPIVWEHGRRNMALQATGVLPLVLPGRDDPEWAGIGGLRRPARGGAPDSRYRPRGAGGDLQLRNPPGQRLPRLGLARLNPAGSRPYVRRGSVRRTPAADPQTQPTMEAEMRAVLIEINVESVDEQAGLDGLRNQLVPAITAMPGFLSGTWLTGNEHGRGLSLTIWKTDEHAQAFADRFGPGSSPQAGATVERCELREVGATA